MQRTLSSNEGLISTMPRQGRYLVQGAYLSALRSRENGLIAGCNFIPTL